MKRLIQPEFLDTLSPDDPGAQRSRRDLWHINWCLRHHVIMARALQAQLDRTPGRITELGAGDGKFLLHVARQTGWNNVEAVLLDRQKNVSADTLAAFSQIGWRAEPLVTDVFDWPPGANLEEVIIANLFLHHFDSVRLVDLLKKVSERTKLFIAIEPMRFTPLVISELLLRLLGCNQITRHDAKVSIRAGFIGQEIYALWPVKKNWRVVERCTRLGSHLFIAKRRE